MITKVLITGGSGLVGFNLTRELLSQGYKVNHLSRGNKKQILGVTTYLWNPDKKEIDERCLDDVNIIIHLAGAGITDKRWTEKRKEEIIQSRVASIELIYDLLGKTDHCVETIISASASGYYSDRGEELMEETALAKNDFLGKCCVLWEQAVDRGKQYGLRIVKLRTGAVLDSRKGALPKLLIPFKLGIGSPLGSGKQWMSWIHIKDVIAAYIYFIKHEISGTYNLSSPSPLRNKDFSQILSDKLKKRHWVPAVPGFVLKLAMGEMSVVLLGSTKMSVQKLLDAGFEFCYPSLELALDNLLVKD